MKEKIALNLWNHAVFQRKEINTHPAYIYTIKAICDSGFFDVVLHTDSEQIMSILHMYGFDCIMTNKNQTKHASLHEFDCRFPLIQPSTLRKLVNSLTPEKFLGISAHDVKTVCQTEVYELLSPVDPVEAMLIEAFLLSEFNSIRPYKLTSGFFVDYAKNPLRPKLLFSAPYDFFPDYLRGNLEKHFDITFGFNAPYSITKSLLADSQYWITGTCPPYKIDEELIASAPALQVVATPSTGTNHIDTVALAKRGIRLLSIKESPVIETIHASSEFSFALMLAVIKKIPFATAFARMGVWRELESSFRNIELHGKTIGLIGLGRIGKKMAGFCNAFGMKVVGYDPYVQCPLEFVEQCETLNDLLIQADIVSLHYHLSDDTVHSFHAKHFSAMKRGAYFINTARGELVVEKDLISALESGQIKAAGVDVISDEHVLEKWNHPLISYARENDNLLISPHIAGCTVDSESKAMSDILSQLLALHPTHE